jgi:hypothetical protein
VAYADPPYIGQAAKYYAGQPDYAGEVDHRALIQRLVADFPDGWALSCTSNSLRFLLPLCPQDVRVGAWVKPFQRVSAAPRIELFARRMRLGWDAWGDEVENSLDWAA